MEPDHDGALARVESGRPDVEVKAIFANGA